MAFTYQPRHADADLAAIGRVRGLIHDTRAEAPLFQDDDLLVFLDEAGGVGTVGANREAAGLALLAIAQDEALLLKKIVTEGLETDGATLAKALTDVAKELFKRADAARSPSAAPPAPEAPDSSDFDVIVGLGEW